MGFLDNVFKAANIAKTVVEEINQVQNQSQGGFAVNNSNNAARERFVPETITLTSTDIAGSKELSNVIYDNEDEKEYEIEQVYKVAPDFYQFSSGAGEVDVVYAYVPGLKEEDYFDWDSSMPYLSIMFDQRAYDIVKKYETTNTVREGVTLEKVQHSTMVYRTSYIHSDGKYVFYHFYRFSKELNYQVSAFIPTGVRNTETETKVLVALDLMADTYRENRKLISTP